MAGPLKSLHLSDENMGSGLFLDWDSEEKPVDEKPSAWNISFSDSKQSYSEEHAKDDVESASSIGQIAALEIPVLGCKVAPNINLNSFPQFLFTKLVHIIGKSKVK
jgi:hypothetical protein